MASELLKVAHAVVSNSENVLINGASGHTYTILSVIMCETAGAAETIDMYIDNDGGGTDFEILSDDNPAKSNDINIGKVNRPEISEIDFPELEEDGFIILTKYDRLSISGGSEKGTLYGVYNFLEEYLGCKKYTSKISVIPARFNIDVKNINDKKIPVFKFREVLYRDAYNPEYMEWHGLDNHGSYNQKGDWGLWCHTTHGLVPPKEYCASHPEYYSMIKGKRLCSAEKHNEGDICFSSEGAFEVASKNLKAYRLLEWL